MMSKECRYSSAENIDLAMVLIASTVIGGRLGRSLLAAAAAAALKNGCVEDMSGLDLRDPRLAPGLCDGLKKSASVQGRSGMTR